MSRKPQTRGVCAFCGQEFAKAGMTRHLSTCSARQQAIAAADSKGGRNSTIYHLQVRNNASFFPTLDDHWLHLEIKGNATLHDLDSYLRYIWLECCGHLSSFEIDDVFYTQLFDDHMGWRKERSMAIRVDKLFTPGLDIPYEYDFGTTSELLIRVLGERQGKALTPHPIYLMARNAFAPPHACCAICPPSRCA